MTRYPAIEPYDAGLLDVGDGHRVHYEVCGNPRGRPALVVHGGPGSGCTPGLRRFFDPARYRVVLVDQRGCGRSRPHASEPLVDLDTNTTAHLVADFERVREHLDIDRWLLFGGSWGSTLSLTYAVEHPERVSAAVLLAITTGRHDEVAWVAGGVARFFPEAWERLRAGLPPGSRDDDVVAGYHRLLTDPDPAVHTPAARRWCDWEDAIVAMAHDQPADPRYLDPRFRLAFARLVVHYFRHRLFLDDGEVLARVPSLAGTPAVLIQGRLDLTAPMDNAWRLHRAWPGSELVVLGGAGHGTGEGMDDAILTALDRFASSC
ncbi:prolyl aminopeptidase [Egicoccus sp. AB-alg6-2]|uniref:prolyl aminopeptidase n=1 Tax=Egicoccus sp. AB-alg6-2 TaxID=3242692 RepID=UPI00359EE12A